MSRITVAVRGRSRVGVTVRRRVMVTVRGRSRGSISLRDMN